MHYRTQQEKQNVRQYYKGIEFMAQTKELKSLYHCNLMVHYLKLK